MIAFYHQYYLALSADGRSITFEPDEQLRSRFLEALGGHGILHALALGC